MSILSHLRKITKPRHYARPTAPVREARRSGDRHPFALGLEGPTVLAVLPVRDEAGKVATLTEHAFPFEQTDPSEQYLWHVRVYELSREVEKQGFDTLRDAQTYLSHVVTPLPVEPTGTFPDGYADEAPGYEVSAPDLEWWAAHDHEVASELDQWLDTLAPDDYETMGMEGGAW